MPAQDLNKHMLSGTSRSHHQYRLHAKPKQARQTVNQTLIIILKRDEQQERRKQKKWSRLAPDTCELVKNKVSLSLKVCQATYRSTHTHTQDPLRIICIHFATHIGIHLYDNYIVVTPQNLQMQNEKMFYHQSIIIFYDNFRIPCR